MKTTDVFCDVCGEKIEATTPSMYSAFDLHAGGRMSARLTPLRDDRPIVGTRSVSLLNLDICRTCTTNIVRGAAFEQV